jgi:hypothetical protein
VIEAADYIAVMTPAELELFRGLGGCAPGVRGNADPQWHPTLKRTGAGRSRKSDRDPCGQLRRLLEEMRRRRQMGVGPHRRREPRIRAA